MKFREIKKVYRLYQIALDLCRPFPVYVVRFAIHLDFLLNRELVSDANCCAEEQGPGISLVTVSGGSRFFLFSHDLSINS